MCIARQGRTIPCVLFAAENETTSPFHSFESVFVAVSRVKKSTDLHIMPLRDPTNLLSFEHLARLRPSRNLLVFLSGYAVNKDEPTAPCTFDARRAFATLLEMIRTGCADHTLSENDERAAKHASREAVARVAAVMRADPTSAPQPSQPGLSGSLPSVKSPARVTPPRKKVELRRLDKKRRLSTSPKTKGKSPKKVAVPKLSGQPRPSTAAQSMASSTKAATKTSSTSAQAKTASKAPAIKHVVIISNAPAKSIAPNANAGKTPPVKTIVLNMAVDVPAPIVGQAAPDADLLAGMAANMAHPPAGAKPDAKQVAAQAAREAAEAATEARIVQRRAAWKVILDQRVAAARTRLAALNATNSLHPFEQHQRRADQLVITEQQRAAFWALPGVEQTLRHLRYEGQDALNGLFDTMKWRQVGVMTNTCPFDSAILAAHVLLCMNAGMLALLDHRAADEQADAKARSAAKVLLDMHVFAKSRLWDEARLVIVYHALFVGDFYSNVAMQSRCFEKDVLDLQASPEYVDGLFVLAGAGIGAWERVTTTTCDRVGCARHAVPHVKNTRSARVIMPKTSEALPTFLAGLRQMNSTIAGVCGHRCGDGRR